MLLLGLERLKEGGRDRILMAATEHKAVLETKAPLESRGFTVDLIAVDADGLIDVASFDAQLDHTVALVSLMCVNNEIGVIQPVRDIAHRAHSVGALVHTDAAQAAGKYHIDVEALDVDFLSLTAHKIYGPIGVGALFVQERVASLLSPQSFGGGQERKLRSGTLSPMLCAGFGEAAKLARENFDGDIAHIVSLRNAFLDVLSQNDVECALNGSRLQRVPHNLNLRFPGVEAAGLLTRLYRQVAAAAGSACTSSATEASHVLRAIGLADDVAASSVRFSFGRFNTVEEVKLAARLVAEAVHDLTDWTKQATVAAE
jgi:cysteine desulfurase